jgi:atypical dual specificity phosphatase
MRIRELRDGLEVEDDEREEQGSEVGSGYGEVVAVVRLRAKRAIVGAGARVLFYPTLLYNVLRNRFDGEFRWWDRIDKVLIFCLSPCLCPGFVISDPGCDLEICFWGRPVLCGSVIQLIPD